MTHERDADNAAVARRHIAASPLGDRIELIEGDARETLPRLLGPFDVVWIDAWKSDYPQYLDLVLPKLAPRRIMVATICSATALRSRPLPTTRPRACWTSRAECRKTNGSTTCS